MPEYLNSDNRQEVGSQLESDLALAESLGWEISDPIMKLHGSSSELPSGSKIMVARLIEPEPETEERIHLRFLRTVDEDKGYTHQAIEAIEDSIDRLSELWADGEKLAMVADKQRDWKNPQTGEWMVN